MVSLTLFLPLLGAIFLMCYRQSSAENIHRIGIATSALTLLGAIGIWVRGIAEPNLTSLGFSQVEQLNWMPSIGAAYRVGVDGISLPLILLAALLFLLTFIYSANVRKQPKAFIVLMLILETAAIGAFTALDAILFYVFFEVSLVSMYFMIAGWGHEDRQRAALMFFIYTLLP